MTAASPSPAWRTLLGDYPNTHALRSGALASRRVCLAFEDVPVPNKAFKRVVREVEFDVAELALMTFLMARSRGVPLRLLPVVVFGRNPLPYLLGNAAHGRLGPADLAGRRVGVRSYTTTTAAWVRALVADRFGLDWDRVEWTTFEDGHVAGAADPPNARRAPAGASPAAMLLDGALDAAIVDPVPVDPRVAVVVTDPDRTYREWRAARGARTLNHVVVVREALADDRESMTELLRLFRDSRDQAGPAFDRDAAPLGLDSMRRDLEVAIEVAAGQGLLARPLTVEDLVTGTLASLT